MTSSDEELTDGITNLTPKLLTTMEAFEQVQRNMHPSRIDQLAEFIAPFEDELKAANESFQHLEFPEHIEKFGEHIKEATTYSLRACNGVTDRSNDTMATLKAMRAQCRAQEKLYPLANILRPISQYFLELEARENADLLNTLNEDRPGQQVGILNADNDRGTRGGFTLYAPEYINASKPTPLVVCLHGGTGHGSDFIWSWLREARTRGFLLLSPTSQMDTWSLMGEEHDLSYLHQTIEFVGEQFALDRKRILLTGMSDGGTYAMLAGIREETPFTHLAPFSGVLHPEISMSGRIAHAKDKNIYLVHGSHDWMFPIETAYMAQAELEAAGANITFKPIEGLSHTYCRTENKHVLDWFGVPLN